MVGLSTGFVHMHVDLVGSVRSVLSRPIGKGGTPQFSAHMK